jgi:hypothetical protein
MKPIFPRALEIEAHAFYTLAHTDGCRAASLSKVEIETIETLARDHMRHYGYELMTEACAALPDDDALRACAKRSIQERTQAWQQLARTNHRDHTLRRFRADYLARVRDNLQARG